MGHLVLHGVLYILLHCIKYPWLKNINSLKRTLCHLKQYIIMANIFCVRPM